MQNFGKIKNVLNNLLAEGIMKKDSESKKTFKKYIKALKESEILKTQFLVYTNLENRIDSDPASVNLFVSENMRLLEKFKTADIIKENEKLAQLVTGTELVDDYEMAPLHEAITNLIFIKRNGHNIDKVLNEMKKVTGIITEHKAVEVGSAVDLPVSMLTKIAVEKYNEKYSSLDETESRILKVLMSEDFEAKKSEYENIVSECATLVDTKVATADDDSKEKLLKVKAKLMSDKSELNESEFTSKFFKLVDLRHNLLNN